MVVAVLVVGVREEDEARTSSDCAVCEISRGGGDTKDMTSEDEEDEDIEDCEECTKAGLLTLLLLQLNVEQ